MTENPLVFIVLDAFRWDYLHPRRTPFLCQLAHTSVHVEKLVTASGFSQRAALFTGAPGDVTGHLAMHRFDPEGSPFRFLSGKMWPRIVDEITRRIPGPVGRVLEARFRSRIYEKARKEARHPSTARIPLHLLPFFSVSEDLRPIQEPGALGVESIFDRLVEAELPFAYLMYPEVDGTDDATERALAARASEDRAVYLGLFSAADQRGHLHGPASTETAGACAELDWRLRRLRRVFHRAGKDPVWLVIGDHGMLEVTRRVDVLGVLRGAARRAGLVEGRDWVAFCDSTAVRIWFLTEKAAAPLASALEALADFGSVATQEIARARRIPFGDRSQGDLLWLAEPGVLVCPDYFHRRDETILGMHGYDPQVDGQKGFAVLGGPGVGRVTIPEGHLVDGCATLCDLLGLVPPSSCEGTSWVGRVVEA